MGRFEKTDVRAALILAFLAAAAGFGRWLMDGSQADAAHLLSGLQHPLKGIDSIVRIIFAAGLVATVYFAWRLLSGLRAAIHRRHPLDR
jgi:hydrogenase/urease accessory protein HupE